MAAIGYAHTLSDLQKTLNPDGSIAQIIEVMNEANPLMEDIVWMEGDLPIGNKTTVRASLPSPEIRRINRGVSPTKGTVKQIIDVCMHLEDRSCIDVELLAGKPNAGAYRIAEDHAHLEGMAQYAARQFMYGNLDDDPDTFNGFQARYNTLQGGKGTPGYQVISAGTPGSNTNTSIYLVDWGFNRVTGIYPKGTQAGLSHRDLGETTVQDENGKRYQAVESLYSWKLGLAVQNVRSVVRIANINAATLNSLTDAAQKSLIDKFIFGKNRLWQPKNPVAYVSEDVYTFLECYLTNKNNIHVTREEVMGAAPVLRFGGIRVKKMDCMTNTEAAVV